MVGITYAINLLVFILCAGVVVSIVVLVPLAVYTIPYDLWVGSQNTRGKHKDKRKEPFFRSVRNATRLYIAWITRREPTF